MSKKNYKSLFFKHEKLPFVESRYVIDSPFHYDKHFHTTLSIGAVEKGKVAYIHGKDEYILSSGELSVINPHVPHYCNPIENESRSYHMIYIDVDWCKELQSTLFKNVDRFIPLDHVQIYDENLYNEYIVLNKTLLNKNRLLLEKEQFLEKFFRTLFLKHCIQKETTVTIMNSEKIDKAKSFIEENYLEDITLDDIASFTQISKFYLTKIFNQQLHISPYKFLMNYRINKAKELLSQGYATVDVANMTGFFDQSHFSQTFKKYVAATPNEYKVNL